MLQPQKPQMNFYFSKLLGHHCLDQYHMPSMILEDRLIRYYSKSFTSFIGLTFRVQVWSKDLKTIEKNYALVLDLEITTDVLDPTVSYNYSHPPPRTLSLNIN